MILALERLQVLRHGPDPRSSGDARLAMKWLDELTNQTNSAVGSRVRIEGSQERYEDWSEVRSFMLPKDFLSVESNELARTETDEDETTIKKISDLCVDDEPDVDVPNPLLTPEQRIVEPASPVSAYTKYSPLLSSSPFGEPKAKILAPIGSGRPTHRKTDSNASSVMTLSTPRPASRQTEDIDDDVPKDLYPFFNHIMWQIKQDPTTDMGVDSYILLTNDLAKQTVAQRFGIRVKRLDQMRDIVVREDQDLKNRIAMQKREAALLNTIHKPPMLGFGDGSPVLSEAPASPTISSGASPRTTPSTPAKSLESAGDDTEEDIILIKPKNNAGPPKGPQAMQHQQPQKGPKANQQSKAGGRPVFDPNSFARGGVVAPPASTLATNGSNSVRGSNRARGFGTLRGNPVNGTGNSSPSASGGRFSERPPSRGVYSVRRGQQASPQQAPPPQQQQQVQQQKPLDLSQPIDPNVFSRASTAAAGRKETPVRRQLWEP